MWICMQLMCGYSANFRRNCKQVALTFGKPSPHILLRVVQFRCSTKMFFCPEFLEGTNKLILDCSSSSLKLQPELLEKIINNCTQIENFRLIPKRFLCPGGN